MVAFFLDNLLYENWHYTNLSGQLSKNPADRVWVEANVSIMGWDDKNDPGIQRLEADLSAVRVYKDLDAKTSKLPTQEQLDLWDLHLRCVEYYEYINSKCPLCSHVYQFHITTDSGFKCAVEHCICERVEFHWEEDF